MPCLILHSTHDSSSLAQGEQLAKHVTIHAHPYFSLAIQHLEASKSTTGGVLCIFGSHTFVPISWMCKKQTSVSHSSIEAEIISLDAGLRMDGIPALILWDLVIEIFHSPPNQTNKTNDVREPRRNLSAKTQPNMQKQIPTMHTNLDLANIDHVSSNVSCFGLVV